MIPNYKCTGGLISKALFGLLMLIPVVASAVGLPHTFVGGTTASASEVNANFRYIAPKNVIFVSPADSGLAEDNGAALLAAVDLATITAINGAPGPGNPYLIKLSPGSYDVGVTSLVMHDYVHIEGSESSGSAATIITSSIDSATAGTIVGASAELRNLYVSNMGDGGTATSVGIYLSGGKLLRLNEVKVAATNSTTMFPIYVAGTSHLIIRDSFVTTTNFSGGGTNMTGIYVDEGSALEMDDVSVVVKGVAGLQFGVQVIASVAILSDATILVTSSSDSSAATGVYMSGTAPQLTATDVNITTSGAGSAGSNGIWVNSATGEAKVHHSVILAGDGVSVGENYVRNSVSGGQIDLATSQLAGDLANLGTVRCVFVYDINMLGFPSTCPVILI